MGIQLQKVRTGQAVDLTKKVAGLRNLTVGLSWGNTLSSKTKDGQPKGLLARAFDKLSAKIEEHTSSNAGSDMDIDSTVVMVDSNRRLVDTIYFGQKESRCRSVIHKGDALSSKSQYGEYDNEEITIDLARIPTNVEKVIFLANIYQGYQRQQHFGQVKGAYIRVLQTEGRQELIHYDLADDYNGMRGIVVGELYRYNGEWKFRAIGQASKDDSLQNLINRVVG